MLNALKEIATILRAKGTPNEALWASSGLTPPSRLKDVEHAIVALRKTFSVEAKLKIAEEEFAAAELAGVTVEEFREREKKARLRGTAKTGPIERRRREGRDLKLTVHKLAQGDFDLKTDYV